MLTGIGLHYWQTVQLTYEDYAAIAASLNDPNFESSAFEDQEMYCVHALLTPAYRHATLQRLQKRRIFQECQLIQSP